MTRVERGTDRVEVSLSGNGGQGLILIGIILAEAAGIHDGKQVVQTQTYGAESRGGLCRADVIISDTGVDHPEVERPDVLLVMSESAARAYVSGLKSSGVLVVDSSEVQVVPLTGARVCEIPFTRLARERFGRALFANIIALGALVAVTDLVTADSARKAVLARTPRGTEEVNLAALELGRELGLRAREPAMAGAS